jgi:hypothetical protein
VASGADEGDVRSALHTHGVVVYSEYGELKVMEPEIASSGHRTPSLLGSQVSAGAGPRSRWGSAG